MSSPRPAAAPEIELSVVLPVHGSREALEPLYERLRSVIDSLGCSCQLVFVEDGCPEESIATLEDLARRDPRIVVLALTENVGQQEAVRIGLLEALGRVVVVMDADLQDPPEALPALKQAIEAGAGIAFGRRRGRHENRLRHVTSAGFKTLLSLLTGVPRDAGMYLAMDQETLDSALSRPRDGFYLITAICLSGRPIVSIPVRRDHDVTSQSGYSPFDRLRVGLGLLRWSLRERWRSEAGAKPVAEGRTYPPPATGYRRIGGGLNRR